MEIKRINNTMTFKSLTNDDLYRLEQKIDSLQSSMNRNDLNSFYKDLPKSNRMPMPIGVPPYAMGSGMYGMPWGPMGRYPMGMPGMIPPGMMGPMGMGRYPMSMPGSMPPGACSHSSISGQPCRDVYCQRR